MKVRIKQVFAWPLTRKPDMMSTGADAESDGAAHSTETSDKVPSGQSAGTRDSVSQEPQCRNRKGLSWDPPMQEQRDQAGVQGI